MWGAQLNGLVSFHYVFGGWISRDCGLSGELKQALTPAFTDLTFW